MWGGGGLGGKQRHSFHCHETMKIEDEWLKESLVGRGGESHWILPIVLVK